VATILFNITNGTNNATKATLGFMLARTAVEEGHKVIVFLNADAVSLVRQPVLQNLVGLGTGSLSEHFEVLKKANVSIYVSAIACEIRGVTQEDLDASKCKKVLPKTLFNLSLDADRTFVY
jgi:predicted peroxiredoxin